MKRVMYLLVALALMPTLAFAGNKDDKVTIKSGNAKFIVEEASTATAKFDFSKAVVEENETIDEYLTRRGEDFVKDWPQVQSDVIDYMAKFLNKKNKKGMQIVNSGTTQYEMVIHVTAIDFGSTGKTIAREFNPFNFSAKTGGAVMSGIVEVLDASTHQSLCEVQINDIKGVGQYGETNRLKALVYDMVRKLLSAVKKS